MLSAAKTVTVARFLFPACALLLAGYVLRADLQLLFIPDPPQSDAYQQAFSEVALHQARNIASLEGFVTDTAGLDLKPGTNGQVALRFTKVSGEGCLLRIWLYGDNGEQRPNMLRISVDDGRSFRTIARNQNLIGAVFDISNVVVNEHSFLILVTAQNYAPFTARVLDRIEVGTGNGKSFRPHLPDISKFIVCLCFVVLPYLLLLRPASLSQRMASAGIFVILSLGAVLRWRELLRIAGTVLDPDAAGYLGHAIKMNLFSQTGFYSAQFGLREPLYIWIVNVFINVFGASATHVRFVSFTFSLVLIYATYVVGRRCFNKWVALGAAGVLAIHPYMIQLSAQGLRAEFFSVVLLLFYYFGCLKKDLSYWGRAVLAGASMGAVLLTRLETFPMLLTIMVLSLIGRRSLWSIKTMVAAVAIALLLAAPHLYRTAVRYGDPFYALNQHARFYANVEFAGQPGFPTRDEIAIKGMYAGDKITPLEFYFGLHSFRQVILRSAVGFVKVHLAMPLSFAFGKGNMGQVLYNVKKVRGHFSVKTSAEFCRQLLRVFLAGPLDYVIACLLLVAFLSGVFFLGMERDWFFLAVLVAFQMQTAFIAYLGVDTRLTVHSYPLIALCCSFAVGKAVSRLCPGPHAAGGRFGAKI